MTSEEMVVADAYVSWGRERLARIFSWIGKGAVVAGALAMALASAVERAGDALAMFWITAWFVFFFAMAVSYVIHFLRGFRRASVRVTRDALTVNYGSRARRVARTDIVGALMVDRPVGEGSVPTLELELATEERIVVRFREPASRVGLRDALGFGPAGARTRVRLAAPSHRLLHLPVGFAIYLVGSVLGQVAMILAISALHLEGRWLGVAVSGSTALMLAAHAIATRLLRPPVVTIGQDGVLVERGFKKEFVARRDLVGVVRSAGALPPVLQLRGGEVRVLGGAMVDAFRRMAVVSQIGEWLAAEAPAQEPSPHFEREGRNVAAWKEHLTHLLDGAGYRGARASAEDAARVLDSPMSTIDQRVGAALALRIANEPQAHVRVQVERLADPTAREAVLAALEDDEPALDAALGRAARLDPGAKSR